MKKRFHLAVICWFALAPLARAGETIDRIIAVVNGRPVMESEMVESLHFEQLLAGRPAASVSPEELREVLGRLVDQTLLAQQMDLLHFQQASSAEIEQRMKQLRAELAPSDSDDTWRSFLRNYDLAQDDVAEHVAQQLRTMRFIDARFRPSVRLEPAAVETYYNDELLPKMKQSGAQPVPMKDVEPKIREILVQQRMDALLESWLKTLRTQAEIRFPIPSSALVEAEHAAQSHSAEVR